MFGWLAAGGAALLTLLFATRKKLRGSGGGAAGGVDKSDVHLTPTVVEDILRVGLVPFADDDSRNPVLPAPPGKPSRELVTETYFKCLGAWNEITSSEGKGWDLRATLDLMKSPRFRMDQTWKFRSDPESLTSNAIRVAMGAQELLARKRERDSEIEESLKKKRLRARETFKKTKQIPITHVEANPSFYEQAVIAYENGIRRMYGSPLSREQDLMTVKVAYYEAALAVWEESRSRAFEGNVRDETLIARSLIRMPPIMLSFAAESHFKDHPIYGNYHLLPWVDTLTEADPDYGEARSRLHYVWNNTDDKLRAGFKVHLPPKPDDEFDKSWDEPKSSLRYVPDSDIEVVRPRPAHGEALSSIRYTPVPKVVRELLTNPPDWATWTDTIVQARPTEYDVLYAIYLYGMILIAGQSAPNGARFRYRLPFTSSIAAYPDGTDFEIYPFQPRLR